MSTSEPSNAKNEAGEKQNDKSDEPTQVTPSGQSSKTKSEPTEMSPEAETSNSTETAEAASDGTAKVKPSATEADTASGTATTETGTTETGTTETGTGDDGDGEEVVELDPLEAMTAERDEYLDALQRLKAEFANARRRADENAARQRQQAAAGLVEKLLPVLDSCDAAFAQGIEEVRPIYSALFDALKAEGLARIDNAEEDFDPEIHEAVLFEPGEGDDSTQVVVEVMRAGYSWNERVLRPAMVKVRG